MKFQKKVYRWRAVERSTVVDLSIAAAGFLLSIWLIAQRWTVLQGLDNYVVGVDSANYLTTMRKVFSPGFTGDGFYRPWLLGVILKPFVELYGTIGGVHLVTAILSVSIAIPMVLLLRRVVPLPIAVPGGISYSVLPVLGTFPFRSFINLLGFALILFTLERYIAALEGEMRPALAGAISLGVLAGSHQTSLLMLIQLIVPLALIFMAPEVVARWRSHSDIVSSVTGDRVQRTMLFAAGGVIASLPFVPAYINQLRQMEGGGAVGSLPSVLAIIDFPLRMNLHFWTALTVLSLVGAVYLFRNHRKLFWVYCIVLAGSVLYPLGGRTYMFRMMWMRHPPIILGCAAAGKWALDLLKARSPALERQTVITVSVCLLLGTAMISGGFLRSIEASHDFNGLDNDRIDAAEHAQNEYTGPMFTGDRQTGWTIEGYGGVNALELANRDYVSFKNQRADGRVADQVALGTVGFAGEYHAAAFGYRGTRMGAIVAADRGVYVPLLRVDNARSSVSGSALGERTTLNCGRDACTTEYQGGSIQELSTSPSGATFSFATRDSTSGVYVLEISPSHDSDQVTVDRSGTTVEIETGPIPLESYASGPPADPISATVSIESDGDLDIAANSTSITVGVSNATETTVDVEIDGVSGAKTEPYRSKEIINKTGASGYVVYEPRMRLTMQKTFEEGEFWVQDHREGDVVIYRPVQNAD
jgi:hypothetical protein